MTLYVKKRKSAICGSYNHRIWLDTYILTSQCLLANLLASLGNAPTTSNVLRAQLKIHYAQWMETISSWRRW